MKEKFFTALKTKFSNLGLGDKALLGMATLLALTNTDEATIETVISAPEVDEALKGMQSEGDRRATIERDKVKQPIPPVPPVPPTPPTPPAPGNEFEQALAKALAPLTEGFTLLSTELGNLKAGKTTETRLQTLTAKLEKAPDLFKKSKLADFGRMTFKDDAAFDEYLTEIDGFVTDATKQDDTQQLQNVPAPVWGSTNKDGVSSTTQAYIDSKKEGAATAGSLTGKAV